MTNFLTDNRTIVPAALLLILIFLVAVRVLVSMIRAYRAGAAWVLVAMPLAGVSIWGWINLFGTIHGALIGVLIMLWISFWGRPTHPTHRY